MSKERSRLGSFLIGLAKFLIFMTVGLIAGYIACDNMLSKYEVVGVSMEPTYESGDTLLIFNMGIPGRGDVVVIKKDELDILKRVIAVPGDAITIRESRVFINGEPIEEGYIVAEEYEGGIIEDDVVTLQSGEYFVLGDNRNNSSDSREFGAIQEEDILGTVLIEIDVET